MAKKRSRPALPASAESPPGYDDVLAGISALLDRARHSTAQAINFILTATYWEVGRRVVELEQRGQVARSTVRGSGSGSPTTSLSGMAVDSLNPTSP